MKKRMTKEKLITLIAVAFVIALAGWFSPLNAFADDSNDAPDNQIVQQADESGGSGEGEGGEMVDLNESGADLDESDAEPNDQADDQSDPIVLNVCSSDGTLIKGFTEAELYDLWASEGNNSYTYSALNTYPTSKLVIGAGGPTVAGIINAAGINTSEIKVIEVVGTDGVKKKFLKDKLLGERYYFPNGAAEQNRGGKAPLAASWNGKKAVPAMISLTVSDSNDPGENYEKRLLFGQVSPNEQTWQASIQYLVGQKTKANGDTVTGTIVLYTEQASRLNPIGTTSIGKGGAFLKNTAFTFDRSVNASSVGPDGRYTIYFTTDGTEPGPASKTSQIYNYNNINFGKSNEKINKPVLSKNGSMIIKTKVVEYGKLDSPVSTFNFTGVTLPAKAAGLKTSRLSYQGLKVSWGRVTGATGYEVSRSTSKTTGFKTVRRITSGSTCTFSDSKGLKTGTAYYYKVRALKTVSGKTFYGSWSALTTGKPVLGKTSITKLKSKKKKITITWTKVAGASGYQIYQAKKSKGSYKLVKTITSQSTDTWKTKKLKKKKKYWYKVRAYRIVGGKKVYGSFSAVKYKKVK